MPFKCNLEDFNKIYQEHYKNEISHEVIRSRLGIPDSVRLKLNGTFKRWLYLLDKNSCLYKVLYKVQTALWHNNETGKWQYVSIFPNFIKRYLKPSIHMLEYISCQVGKGENIFEHIDDPEMLLDCEDFISRPMIRIEKECAILNYSALLNSKYTEIYNKPITLLQKDLMKSRRFGVLYHLVLTARQFFGEIHEVLTLANTVILL